MNEGPLSQVRAQERPFRFPEEFRAPLGVRKSGMLEPAVHADCPMGFWSFGRVTVTTGARMFITGLLLVGP